MVVEPGPPPSSPPHLIDRKGGGPVGPVGPVSRLASHTDRRLNGFILAIYIYSGSGDYKSSLYTSSSAVHEQYVVSLRVVTRCCARRLANALMPSEGGKLSTRSNGT